MERISVHHEAFVIFLCFKFLPHRDQFCSSHSLTVCTDPRFVDHVLPRPSFYHFSLLTGTFSLGDIRPVCPCVLGMCCGPGLRGGSVWRCTCVPLPNVIVIMLGVEQLSRMGKMRGRRGLPLRGGARWAEAEPSRSQEGQEGSWVLHGWSSHARARSSDFILWLRENHPSS